MLEIHPPTHLDVSCIYRQGKPFPEARQCQNFRKRVLSGQSHSQIYSLTRDQAVSSKRSAQQKNPSNESPVPDIRLRVWPASQYNEIRMREFPHGTYSKASLMINQAVLVS